MASGLPVVSTAVGGVPEVIRDGLTGMLAEPADEEGLTEKVAQVLTDPELRVEMGCRGREFVRGHHSLTRLPQCLQEFYRTILNNHHHSMSPDGVR
jgi:glycosyltransferase involved in cell wall biosynthesis